jgi:hypothetical protein
MPVNASVYLKKTGGVSQLCGDSSAAMGGGRRGGRVNLLTDHAERKAWRGAWKTIREKVTAMGSTETYEVLIEVDKTVCADCQKWMLVEVRRQLGQLGRTFKLCVEVPPEDKMGVTRDAVWNVKVGQCKVWKASQFDLDTGAMKKSEAIYSTAT